MADRFVTRFRDREGRRLASGLVALSCILWGCGLEDTGSRNWRAVLDGLEGSSEGMFSLVYVAPPEDGTMVRLALTERESSLSCEAYGSGDSGSVGDFWYLSVTLGAPDPGTYRIAASVDQEAVRADRGSAFVRLVEVRSWEKHRVYPAARGHVVVDDAPAGVAGWRAGKGFEGSVFAEFPASPLRELECHGSASAEGSTRTCECVDDDGHVTTCVPEGEDSCCLGEAPYVALRTEVRAAQCADMCVVSDPTLVEHCERLR